MFNVKFERDTDSCLFHSLDERGVINVYGGSTNQGGNHIVIEGTDICGDAAEFQWTLKDLNSMQHFINVGRLALEAEQDE